MGNYFIYLCGVGWAWEKRKKWSNSIKMPFICTIQLLLQFNDPLCRADFIWVPLQFTFYWQASTEILSCSKVTVSWHTSKVRPFLVVSSSKCVLTIVIAAVLWQSGQVQLPHAEPPAAKSSYIPVETLIDQ